MAIYYDPFYVYRKESWRALGIPYIEGVGSAGNWNDIRVKGWDVVTGSPIDDPDVVKIEQEDGKPGGAGPLSALLAKKGLSEQKVAPEDAIKKEDQRVAAGAVPKLSDSTRAALSQPAEEQEKSKASSATTPAAQESFMADLSDVDEPVEGSFATL